MNICIFGGSATWGQEDNQNGGWVNLLRNHLAKSHVYTYNLGISGDTTNEMVFRAAAEAKARKPNLIIFSIGLNDSALMSPNQTPRVPNEKFLANIATLLKITQDLSAPAVFIGPTSVIESKTTPIPWNTVMSYTNSSAKEFDKALKVFCASQNVVSISLVNLLSENDIAPDGLHPNTSGHLKIFQTVKPIVEKLISQDQ